MQRVWFFFVCSCYVVLKYFNKPGRFLSVAPGEAGAVFPAALILSCSFGLSCCSVVSVYCCLVVLKV